MFRPMYAAAQALVFPSYREGFPNVVLEAGAFSLPSIVTDINGSREIITHGKNGFIVPSHDSTTLADAMMEMWNFSSPKDNGCCGTAPCAGTFRTTLWCGKISSVTINNCYHDWYPTLHQAPLPLDLAHNRREQDKLPITNLDKTVNRFTLQRSYLFG